jgi:hypothetical protein
MPWKASFGQRWPRRNPPWMTGLSFFATYRIKVKIF